MKQQGLLIFVILAFFHVNAQKVSKKELQAGTISTVKINANNSFRIYVETAAVSTISVKTLMEGENSEQLVLSNQTKNDTLFVSTAYQPLFKAKDDKLSAHKVISIEYHIILPKGLNLNIASDIGSVYLKGEYEHVFTELLSGHFSAIEFTGSAVVNTIQGDITVVSNYATVNAHTKHGKVKLDKLELGANTLLLNSINGDIHITKKQ